MELQSCPTCGFTSPASHNHCSQCGSRLGAGPAVGQDPSRQLDPGSTPPGVIAPYAAPPPHAAGVYGQHFTAFREGKYLVVHETADLPDRCIKCNAPANGTRLTKKFSWHHPALALLVLVCVPAYLIAAFVTRQTAVVSLGFCDVHFQRRRMAGIITFIMVVGSIVAILTGLATDSDGLAGLGFLALVASIVPGIVFRRYTAVTKIDNKYVWMTGINKEYLDGFSTGL
ncbi:MAG TPA: hypothetical protein VJX67_09865 [Blastocatellia bacterium]|nr:hypothetical protein [Blastocatellia bacterium]